MPSLHDATRIRVAEARENVVAKKKRASEQKRKAAAEERRIAAEGVTYASGAFST